MIPGRHAVDPRSLLRRLLPAVSPARTDAPRVPFEQRGFDEMLMLASSGALESGRAVAIAPRAGVDPALDDAQMRRLGAAADRAEAAGSRRALVLLDGRGLVLDVADRRVDAELGSPGATTVAGDDGDVATGVDAAVFAGRDDAHAASGASDVRPARGVLRPPGALMPAGAARVLLERSSDGDASAA